MKAFYLAPRNTVEQYAGRIRAGDVPWDVHWIHTLPDGTPVPHGLCLVVAAGEDAQIVLEAMDGVEGLPSLFDGKPLDDPGRQKKMKQEHRDALAALGVDAGKHNCLETAKQLAKIHGKFRVSGA
jgi:hypothetical protein